MNTEGRIPSRGHIGMKEDQKTQTVEAALRPCSTGARPSPEIPTESEESTPVLGTGPDTAPVEAGKVLSPEGGPAARNDKKAPRRKRKGITFKGICIFCGERFSLGEEEISDRSIGFCSLDCRMKFDMELVEEID
jgi:hypothetical protein